MAWVFYDLFKKSQIDGSSTNTPINFSTDTLKIMLITSVYTPTKATDQYRSQTGLAANEVSGTNYTARGATLASKTFVVASDVLTVDAADISFAQSAGGFSTARYAVLYKDSGTDTTSPLIAYYDLGSNQGNVNAALLLQINVNNLFTLT